MEVSQTVNCFFYLTILYFESHYHILYNYNLSWALSIYYPFLDDDLILIICWNKYRDTVWYPVRVHRLCWLSNPAVNMR